jgi:hypothetical protein
MQEEHSIANPTRVANVPTKNVGRSPLGKKQNNDEPIRRFTKTRWHNPTPNQLIEKLCR